MSVSDLAFIELMFLRGKVGSRGDHPLVCFDVTSFSIFCVVPVAAVGDRAVVGGLLLDRLYGLFRLPLVGLFLPGSRHFVRVAK